ncbi:tRNA pseudouridine(38/39) synthase [Anaeramoeba ignava]|uniref:tRNA pseudouridine(38/39) synthase n=1 Tax=Anaeramoeba ignava TaxID=1746090 RepID=A0A9Q0LE98_ANAIG|nr:tRNA pseudouridine(38/39) synthase [Anaeramoeba ignava]
MNNNRKHLKDNQQINSESQSNLNNQIITNSPPEKDQEFESKRKNVSNKSQQKEKKQKKERKFDFGKFHKRHIAFKLAYLGWKYQGFALNGPEDETTVEAHLFKALKKTCLVDDIKNANYTRSGRTDKGVSAFGQVICLDVRSNLSDGIGILPVEENTTKIVRPKELEYIKMLNSVLPKDIKILSWSPVNIGYNARFNCKSRTYKYFFLKKNLDIELMNQSAQKFIGEHDFRNFCKIDPEKKHFNRRILECSIEKVFSQETNGINSSSFEMYVFNIKGWAFLWHQIRMMVAILFMIGNHQEKPEIIDYLFDVENVPLRPQYDMAPDNPLVLYDCEYDDLDFKSNTQETYRVFSSFNSIFEKLIFQSSMANSFSVFLNISEEEKALYSKERVHVPLKERKKCDPLKNSSFSLKTKSNQKTNF